MATMAPGPRLASFTSSSIEQRRQPLVGNGQVEVLQGDDVADVDEVDGPGADDSHHRPGQDESDR